MGRMVNMLFFDAANGKWGRSKPQPPPPLPNHSSITLVVAQFAALDISEDAAVVAAKQFADSIKSRCPTVVALNGVHEQILKALLSVDWIKQEYGVSEVHQPLGSVLLWHAGLPVQLAEGSEKPSYSAINMRRFFGCDCVVVAATFDQSATPETRTLEVHQVLQKASAGEGSTTLALFNPYQSPTYTGVIRDLLNKVRDKMGISEDLATPTEGPTVWLKGNNMMLSGVAPISVAHDAVASCIAATLLPTTQRSPLPEGNSPTPGSETPSNEAASPFPSTPPITSEAAAAAAASKKRMWSTKHSSAIRVRDGTDEVHYDLSVYFPKTEDGIKALCAGAFAWPVDYAILQGRLLAVHGQNADIPSFRQYMNNHPAPPKPNMTGVPGAVQPVVPRTEEKRRVKDPSNFSPYCLTTPTLSAGRRRTWSVYRVALLVQVTPREMRFDITEFVGVGPGTLQLAVARLNGQQTKPPQNNKQGGAGGNNNGGAGGNAGGAGGDDGDNDPEDPLHNYRFDYALLYSSERHGYWLIAASDVPCDVISCRLAAKSLGASVASLLRAGAGN